MAIATSSEHLVISESKRDKAVEALQPCLSTLIDLALQLKQAHWNLLGDLFLSFHVQLDTIIEAARAGSDEVAERIATLAVAADGRAATVDQESSLEKFPAGRHSVKDTVSMVADRLAKTVERLRQSMESVADTDPISEDLLIGVCRTMEKHLWMVQSQDSEHRS